MKKLLALAAALMLAAVAVFGCIGTIAETETDYIDTTTATVGGNYSWITEGALHGTRSLAWTPGDVTSSANYSWDWDLPVCDNGPATDDYLLIDVKNTDAVNAIGFKILAKVNNGSKTYLPTYSTAQPASRSNNVRAYDKDGNEVWLNQVATLNGGIIGAYSVIPAGFEGTLAFYMKDAKAFFGCEAATDADYATNISITYSFQSINAYTGSFITDNVRYGNVAVESTRMLADISEMNDIILDGFNTGIGGMYFADYAGERMIKATLAEASSNLIYPCFADTYGYEYVAIRFVNNSDNVLPLVTTGYQDSCLNNTYKLFDKTGIEIAAGNTSWDNMKIPANFDGYIYVSLIDTLCQGGQVYSRTATDTTVTPHPHGSFSNVKLSTQCYGWLVMNVNGAAAGSGSSDVYFGDIFLCNDISNSVKRNISKILNFNVMNALESFGDVSGQVFAYTEGSDDSVHGELLNEAGNKAFKATWDKTHLSIFKLNVKCSKTVQALDANAYGFGFYVETASAPIGFGQIMIPEGSTAYTSAELYSIDGTYYGTVGFTGDATTIPANFKGYLCFPFGTNPKDINFSSMTCWFDAAVDATLVIDEFGYFSARPDQSNIIGVQYTEVSENKFSARIIMGIDSLAYEELNFRYQATLDGTDHWAGYQTAQVESVFTTIHVDDMDDVTAEELGYKYLSALTIEDIPATGTVVLKVYGQAISSACNTKQSATDTYKATFTNGVFVSFTK